MSSWSLHPPATRRLALLLPAAAIWALTGCQTNGGGESSLAERGLTYEFRELKTPRPNRLHILRVELGAGHLAPVVIVAPDPDGDGPAEVALTDPLTLIAGQPVLAFVNTNPWDSFPDAQGKKNRLWYGGQPVDITGLAMTGGKVRSEATKGRGTVWFDAAGKTYIGAAPEGTATVEGVEGWNQIVKDGEIAVKPSGNLAPRTSIGVSADRRVLWLLVVDGRQPGFSEGMDFHELATQMRELGCHEAAGMDGGGSTIMGLAGADGRMEIVNSPSDRLLGFIGRIRPLPMVLTIQPRPAP